MSSELADCVARGTALLDTRYPEWYEHIDLTVLDIASPADCVLGQTFGFASGLIHLGIVARAASFGFAAEPANYPELNTLWRDEILKKRSAAILVKC